MHSLFWLDQIDLGEPLSVSRVDVHWHYFEESGWTYSTNTHVFLCPASVSAAWDLDKAVDLTAAPLGCRMMEDKPAVGAMTTEYRTRDERLGAYYRYVVLRKTQIHRVGGEEVDVIFTEKRK